MCDTQGSHRYWLPWWSGVTCLFETTSYLLMLCCIQKLTDGVYCMQWTLLVYQSAANSSVWYTYIWTYIWTIHHTCWNLSVCLTLVVVDDSAFLFSDFIFLPPVLPPLPFFPPWQVSVCAMEILCLLIQRLKDRFKPHIPSSTSAKESSI